MATPGVESEVDATIEGYNNTFRLLMNRFQMNDVAELSEGIMRQFFL